MTQSMLDLIMDTNHNICVESCVYASILLPINFKNSQAIRVLKKKIKINSDRKNKKKKREEGRS